MNRISSKGCFNESILYVYFKFQRNPNLIWCIWTIWKQNAKNIDRNLVYILELLLNSWNVVKYVLKKLNYCLIISFVNVHFCLVKNVTNLEQSKSLTAAIAQQNNHTPCCPRNPEGKCWTAGWGGGVGSRCINSIFAFAAKANWHE